MQTCDFDYELPGELIAQRPPEKRGESRMLVLNRQSGEIAHRRFSDLPEFLTPNDLLVLNNTRVLPARFFSNDGKKEMLRIESLDSKTWKCLVKPGKRLREGKTIEIGEATGTVVEILEEGGERIIRFDREPDENSLGHLALPPYITREDDSEDKERYQTVFGTEPGAIAAPTAGLHFSTDFLETLPHEFVTLHVGLGTFRPVSAEKIEDHHMHSEWYSLGGPASQRIATADRVIAVGTTVVRVLESRFREAGLPLKPGSGETDIFIYPPFEFEVVGGLLTNFHLPKSTLLMLVSAFAGRENVLRAYNEAVREGYRFFSYGDCMLCV